MSEVETSWSRRKRRILTALYVVLALVAVFEVFRALGAQEDYKGFVAMGQAMLAGQIPYDPAVERSYIDHHWATWPPSFVTVGTALALLDRIGRPPFIMLWQVLNWAGLGVMLAFSAQWLYDRRLSLRPGPGRIPLLALPMAVALFLPFRLVLSNFEHVQMNLLIHGIALGGFWLMGAAHRGEAGWMDRLAGKLGRRGSGWAGGLAVGFATSFKATPLLLLPYLAWRGRWRDLGRTAAGAALAWLALPAAVLGLGGHSLGAWYRAWWGRTAGVSIETRQVNQSIQATVARLEAGVGPGDAPEVARAIEIERLGVLGGADAAPWVAAIMAVVVAAAAIAYGRPARRVHRRREALELGILLAAMALFSPLGWKAHFVGLVVLGAALFAYTAKGRAWRASGAASAGAGGDRRSSLSDRVVYGVLAIAFLAVNGTASDLIGGDTSNAFEMAGVVTWPALAMILAGLWLLWRERRAGEAAPARRRDAPRGSPEGASRPAGSDRRGPPGAEPGEGAAEPRGGARSEPRAPAEASEGDPRETEPPPDDRGA